MHPGCALIVRTSERRVNVWKARPEPISEAASDELGSRRRRRTFHDVVLTVEKIGGVDGIGRHRYKAGESVEDRRRPLPSVADEVLDPPSADSGWIRADR